MRGADFSGHAERPIRLRAEFFSQCPTLQIVEISEVSGGSLGRVVSIYDAGELGRLRRAVEAFNAIMDAAEAESIPFAIAAE